MLDYIIQNTTTYRPIGAEVQVEIAGTEPDPVCEDYEDPAVPGDGLPVQEFHGDVEQRVEEQVAHQHQK